MREEIIKAAIRLSEESGVKFTLSELARSMKISKKTIYKFFDGKADLINAAIDYIFQDIHNQSGEIMKQGIPNRDKLKLVLSIYPTVISFDSLKLNKLVELYPEIHESILRQFSINWDLTEELFRLSVKEGSIRDINFEYFKAILLGIFDNSMKFENHKEVTLKCIETVFEGFNKAGGSYGG